MQLLFLRYFPGLTARDVTEGPDGNGMPWDWWEFGTAYITAKLQTGG